MSILAKLTLTDLPQASAQTSEQRLRQKMVAAIDTQIALAEATVEGQPFRRTALKWVDDGAGGREKREVPVRTKRWFNADVSGKIFIQLVYGTRPIEIAKGKKAVQVAGMDQVVPTLKQLRAAVVAGELDSVLSTARNGRQPPRRSKKAA